MALTDWSTTAGSNTTVGGVSIAENVPPANLNDGMRAIMADARTWYNGLFPYEAVAADDTQAVNDANKVLGVDATGAGRTITLPASTSGRVYTVIKTDSSVNTVTVDGDGTDTINGQTTWVLRSQYDYVILVGTGSSSWVVVSEGFQPATYGECRLSRTNATTLTLSRHNGRYLSIKSNGRWVPFLIPAAGITVDTTGLAANTTYYCYAYDSSGTLTLELVATAYATDSDTGIKIKNADATRTLVGLARTNASTQFPDSPTMLRNWYQRERVSESGAYSADRSTASTSYVELNTEIRVEFLCWSGEAVHAAMAGRASNTTAGQSTALVFGLDGTVAGAQTAGNFGAATQSVALAAEMEPSEGYHYLTLLAAVTGGTGTVAGAANFNSASAIRSTLHVAVG